MAQFYITYSFQKSPTRYIIEMMFDSSKNNKSYYCVPSSNFNYTCISIDEQIVLHIQRVQIAPEVLPKIRRAYLADIAHYTTHQGREGSS